MLKEILYSCINSFWGGILLRITKPLFFLAGKKQKWDKYKSYRFLWSYSKEKLEKKAQSSASRFVVIDTGRYNYNYFNIAFLHNRVGAVTNRRLPYWYVTPIQIHWLDIDDFDRR